MSDAAGHATSAWSSAAMVLGLIVLSGSMVAVFAIHDRRVERRLYWGGCLGGGALLALAALAYGPQAAAAVMIAFVLGPAIVAVRFSPYLKIGGRIIAARASDRRRDPPRTTDRGT